MINNEKFICTVPVVLFTFNRPYLLEKQISSLKDANIRKLYFASDGPREDVEEDFKKIKESREYAKKINWDCEIIKVFSEKNMGCDIFIPTVLSQVFQIEKYAIILEDDCLPNISFFRFCCDLLEKYMNDERIAFITGHNKNPNYKMIYSYCFTSGSSSIWGWATWSRAWKLYHWDEKEWNERKKNKEQWKGIHSKKFCLKWEKEVDSWIKRGGVPWDYVWRFSINNRLTIVPSVNLIQNRGFGEDATHCVKPYYGYVDEVHEITEMHYPPMVEEDIGFSKAMEKQLHIPLWYRILHKALRVFKIEK